MNDLDEKRNQLQDLVKSVMHIDPRWSDKDTGKIIHSGGRTCAVKGFKTTELVKFLDKAEDSITLIAITQVQLENITVILRI